MTPFAYPRTPGSALAWGLECTEMAQVSAIATCPQTIAGLFIFNLTEILGCDCPCGNWQTLAIAIVFCETKTRCPGGGDGSDPVHVAPPRQRVVSGCDVGPLLASCQDSYAVFVRVVSAWMFSLLCWA